MNKVYLVYVETMLHDNDIGELVSIFANLKDAEKYLDDNKYKQSCNIQEWEVE